VEVEVEVVGEESRMEWMREVKRAWAPPRVRCLKGMRKGGRFWEGVDVGPEVVELELVLVGCITGGGGYPIPVPAEGVAGESFGILLTKSQYSVKRPRSQKLTLLCVLQKASTGLVVLEPGKREKRMNMISESGIANWRSRVYWACGAEAVGLGLNAERVSRDWSWVVGAEREEGTGFLEEKPVMAQRTMQFSSWHLEKMRSSKNATLDCG
jgi:hypothetical protein